MHSHSHHHHGHSHHAHPGDFGRAFAIGILLNLAFVAVEAPFGFLANSMALLADAGHNLSDVLGLVAAWAGAVLSRRPPSRRFSYGLRGSSILAALANAVLLLVAVGFIVYHAAFRLIIPEVVAGPTIILVAAIGVVVNGLAALMFMRGRSHDLNVRGAYLHMVADALVSVGVVVSGVAIIASGWHWIDPVVSLVIAGVILVSTWDLLRESLTLALHGVPAGIDPDEVEGFLAGRPGVAGIHHLHIWPTSTTETALTAHLVMPEGFPGDRFLAELRHECEHRFRITHATFQVELGRD